MFVRELSADPLAWLASKLSDLPEVLKEAGVSADVAGPDDAGNSGAPSRTSWTRSSGWSARCGAVNWARLRRVPSRQRTGRLALAEPAGCGAFLLSHYGSHPLLLPALPRLILRRQAPEFDRDEPADERAGLRLNLPAVEPSSGEVASLVIARR